uniref:Uncharacterized protein n=1 Tax=Anguilla anguilla TaxID=7936 RepID=A0A0E9RRN4_ANGAN
MKPPAEAKPSYRKALK